MNLDLDLDADDDVPMLSLGTMTNKFAALSNYVPHIPSAEELLANSDNYCSIFKENCISSWLPKLNALGIRTPKTVLVECKHDFAMWILGCDEPENKFPDEQVAAQVLEACNAIGYPCFLRTGQTSNKHDWDETCFSDSPEKVQKHVNSLGLFSAMVDLPANVFAVREMIPTAPVFYAFDGNMPITREFRFFSENGRITHMQPYWPPLSIKKASDPDWKEKLAVMNAISGVEYTELAEKSNLISLQMDREWSIDWLQDKNGEWWCTDMAIGSRSYRWDPKTGEEI